MKDFPPTESLAAMLAAARHGSLSKAAEELGVTHGAISRRITALEKWLGSPIFERHGRGVRLTPIGSKLSARVTRSMGAITALARDIRSARKPNAVRVSVLPSVARLWLVPNLGRLQGNPPDLDVQITAEHRIASLESREADLAIRVGRGEWAGMQTCKIFDEVLVPVVHPRWAATLPSKAEAILALPLLHDGNNDDWRRWFAAMDVPFRPTAIERRFDDYDLVLTAARAGIGVALARLPLAEHFLRESGLVRLSFNNIPAERAHWIVCRQSEARRPVLRLIERIQLIAAEEAAAPVA